MKRLILLWFSLLISILFLSVPNTGEVHFAFSDVVLTWKMWAYFMGEHLVLVFIGIAVVMYETKYRFSAWLFLSIQILDTVDFSLTYAEPWTNSPISFNTIKVITFGASIAVDIIKNHVGHTEAN